MKKVITYGTYDLLHFGHVRLLERAKALGDYLIVGVTADDFDLNRGKINVQQSLMERIEAVKATGLADEIIVEEYEGQKIDDIKRYGVDIFTVGSDWVGKFDYLNEYCKVVYLDRTQGVSSSELRAEKRNIRIGLVGEPEHLVKFKRECAFVNGIEVVGAYSINKEEVSKFLGELPIVANSYEELLLEVDAVYLLSHPTKHYEQAKKALESGKNVLCEAPIALKSDQLIELEGMAKEKGLILMNGIKTAYATAYYRLLLLVKSGRIGKPVSVETTCTSMRFFNPDDLVLMETDWNSICSWGPVALLPVFQILGTEYKDCDIITSFVNKEKMYDKFTKINFLFKDAVATVKVGKGIKSEGEMVIAGTKGYVYVPAPWWKTEYFEIRYENQTDNKKFFYQLDGEGLRYEIVSFVRSVNEGIKRSYIDENVAHSICEVIENFYNLKLTEI